MAKSRSRSSKGKKRTVGKKKSPAKITINVR